VEQNTFINTKFKATELHHSLKSNYKKQVLSLQKPNKQINKMNTTKAEIEFQIWQLSRAITSDWSNATPEGAERLRVMVARLNKYKAMLPFAK